MHCTPLYPDYIPNIQPFCLMLISIPCTLRLLMAALNYAGLSIVGWVAACPWVGRL